MSDADTDMLPLFCVERKKHPASRDVKNNPAPENPDHAEKRS